MGKRVALVLGSGGARGYAHIGVIEELEARGYEIGCIAGCSMGAVVGGIYAAGKLDEYRQWIESLDYLAVLRLLDVSFRLGAINGKKVFGKVRDIIGDVNIEDLPIPFTAVATDLGNQQELWFQEGSLNLAMRASAAIPTVFTPVMHGGRLLVDGGLLNPLPIIPVVSSHCDLIIAVNVNSNSYADYQLPEPQRPPALISRFDQMMSSLSEHLPSFLVKNENSEDVPPEDEPPLPEKPVNRQVLHEEITPPPSLLELVTQSLEVMQNSLAQYKIAGYPPDLLINIPKRACRFFEFYRAPELIQIGQQMAAQALDEFERKYYI